MAKVKSKQKNKFNYGDYLAWPADERWELIDGEAFDMTPSPSSLHQEISGNLFFPIREYLEGKSCKVFTAPFDVLLPDSDEPDNDVRTIVQPDILIVCDFKKIVDRGCRGAPDWIIEIISPSTTGKDHIQKKYLYERHGVNEYWLVHPVERTIVVYHLSEKNFGHPVCYDEMGLIKVRVLSGLEIDCSKVFSPRPKIIRESPRKYLS